MSTIGSISSIRGKGLAAVLSLALAFGTHGTVSAHEPTCSNTPLGVEVHGQHIVRDYVTGGETAGEWPPDGGVGKAIAGEGAAVPGGPGPGFHFEHGVAPGASFCNPQAQSPGVHLQ